ncbi:MAG: ATP synthase F1 subunit gamma [Thermodesulfobacteriota bacterium]
MASLKEVKTKIDGVKKTQQITRAMNMVASAKLRSAQEKMESFKPYAEKFKITLQRIGGNMTSGNFTLMEKRHPVNRAEIVVVTSDRGLCGSFNANIIGMAEKLMQDYEAEGKEVSFICIGKKGNQYFRKTGKVRERYLDIMSSKFQMDNARTIAQNIGENFIEGKSDEVKVVYGGFKSIMRQEPVTVDFLPIQPSEVEEEVAEEKKELKGAYIYEPEPEEIMEILLPLYLNVMVYNAMVQVGASEHAARMTAMENATNACKDMIHDLTTIYNKARQAAVTGELMDIVGGAEALK